MKNNVSIMKNNVYVAGSCKNRVATKNLMDDIKKWGFNIAFDWTNRTNDIVDDLKEDIKGLIECDCFIYCMDGIKSRGKYFELGYVSALNKPIGIYLLPTYYHIINPNSEDLPFSIIIENESVFIRSRIYPILNNIDELKKWLIDIRNTVEQEMSNEK